MTRSLKIRLLIGAAGVAALTAPLVTAGAMAEVTVAEAGQIAEDNVLMAEWTGPFGGVPAFDQMDLDALKPALEAGMALHLAEIDAIADNAAPATFENTIVALERAGADYQRVSTYYGIWSANVSTPEFRSVQQEMAPKLSAYRTKISQNQALFDRIRAVHDGAEFDTLRDDQKRLVELVYDGFVRSGALLDEEAKARYAEISQRLAVLYTDFSNNVLHDEESYVTYLTADQLGGLPESFVKSMAAAAEERGEAGKYAVTNTRSSMDPFLTFSTERSVRETVWRTYYNRGDNGDAYDNNALIAEILKLRDERVALLGYDNYAEWRLADRMAKTPAQAYGLMMEVWPAAVARVHEEVADMQAVADAEGADITIEPWDYRFYAEKVRQQKYDLDSDEVKQYLQLDNLREAMFFVAGELFNFDFTPVEAGTVPVFHPDVKVWQVTDRTSGDLVGLWYLDPFARAGKRSGAWATTYRDHTTYDGAKTVLASNNSNFIKGAPGEPVLMSWDDATTYFHEFGHALHYLSSRVAYPTLNGGVRDYTEFQSQLLERWLSTDAVIDKYLVHYETGEPIPADLVAKIKNAATFNQGFSTTEYLASALVDMAYHARDDAPDAPLDFEAAVLSDLRIPEAIAMRHRSPHFQHIFSGDGYAAGYYSYMWSEVMDADAFAAFEEAGDPFHAGMAEKLKTHIYSSGGTIDPEDAYKAFRGRLPTPDAMLKKRGLA